MSADRLRAAAAVLRESAEAAIRVTGSSDWFEVQRTNDWFGVRSSGGLVCGEASPDEAAYIATMSPPVALALADWLDATAHGEIAEYALPCGWFEAITVADLILGTN